MDDNPVTDDNPVDNPVTVPGSSRFLKTWQAAWFRGDKLSELNFWLGQ